MPARTQYGIASRSESQHFLGLVVNRNDDRDGCVRLLAKRDSPSRRRNLARSLCGFRCHDHLLALRGFHAWTDFNRARTAALNSEPFTNRSAKLIRVMNHFFQHLSQSECVHVLINPIPVYGLAIGVLALFVALFFRVRGALIPALVAVCPGRSAAEFVIRTIPTSFFPLSRWRRRRL